MSGSRKIPRPGFLLRCFFRAPVFLYRIGLGGLMPMQLQLTTVGRKSGRPRRVVVDVLRHRRETDTYYLVSVWGERSDWYRNLQANPGVSMQVRWRTFSGQAATVSEKEAEELLVDFWRRHRLYVRMMLRLIGLKVDTEEELRAMAVEMRVLSVRPKAA